MDAGSTIWSIAESLGVEEVGRSGSGFWGLAGRLQDRRGHGGNAQSPDVLELPGPRKGQEAALIPGRETRE